MYYSKTIFLTTLFLMLISGLAFSQKKHAPLPLHLLSNEQGLSENTNAFIYKDKMGFVWLSSIDGLNLFDGKKIQVFKQNFTDTFSIGGPNIQSSFFETQNGNIWFTTYESLNCYNRIRNKFYKYYLNKNGTGYHAFYLEKKKFLWLTVEGEICRVDVTESETKIQKITRTKARRFAVDTLRDGCVAHIYGLYWANGDGCEIFNFDKNYNTIRHDSFFTGVKHSKFPKTKISYALFENDSTVWMATYLGLLKFNPRKPELYQITKFSQNSERVSGIAFKDAESLWITTPTQPLSVFYKKSKKIQPIQSALFSDWDRGADDLIVDNSKNLWISAWQKGTAFYNTKQNNFYQPYSDSTDKSIFNIAEDDTGYWLSSRKKTISLINSKVSKFEKQSDLKVLKNNQKWSIQSPKRICKFDSKTNTFVNIQPILGLENNMQFGYLTNQNDSILFIGNTNGGIYRYGIKNYTLSKITLKSNDLIIGSDNDDIYGYQIKTSVLDELKFGYTESKIDSFNRRCYKIHIDKQNKLWFGSGGEMLLVYRLSESGTDAHYLKYMPETGGINTFHESMADPNTMWIGTGKGLLKINKLTLTDTLITEKGGLPNHYIQGILEDKKGYLWCSTNKGIFRYHPVLKTIKHYTKSNGLINSEYNPSSALYTKKGEMWFGGPNGIDAFVPEEITDIGEAPQLAITGLKIHDKYWRGDTNIVLVNQISLPYFNNTLTFEMAAMEYTDPEKNKFKVMLEGFDKEWVNLGTQNFVTYVNLPHGDYTFKFTACNSEGIWNDAPRVLKIQIVPPFWRRWWFQVAVTLASLTLVVYIVYLRLSKVIELQRVRLKLYENLHDDIGSRLTAIVLSVDELMQRQKEKEPKLSLIGDISKNIVNNMRRLIWATAPENDALNNVVEKMQADRRLLLTPEIGFTIDLAPTIQKLEISGDKRYQMMSVFSEAMSNISKYAEAKNVLVHIYRQGDNLVTEIKDNGVGFDKNQSRADKPNSSGYGLVNMQRRAHRINGKLTITSKPGEGTRVQLIFPIYDESFFERMKSIFKRQ